MFGLLRSLIVLAALVIGFGVYRGWVAFSKPNQDPNNPNVNFNVSVDKSRLQADLGKGISAIERKIQQAGVPNNGQNGYAPNYGQPGYQPPGYGQAGYQQPINPQAGYQQPNYQQPSYQQPNYQQPGQYAPSMPQNGQGGYMANNGTPAGGAYGASYTPNYAPPVQAVPYVNGNGGGGYAPQGGPASVPAPYGDPNAGGYSGGR